MTLQLEGVAARLPELIARYREELVDVAAAGLEAAESGLARWSRDPDEGNAAIERAMADETAPYALALGDPLHGATPAPPPSPATVVAADGSTIAPDRYAAVRCFVVNVGWAVLPYGTPGEPALDSAVEAGLDRDLLGDGDELMPAPRGLGVRLLRDVRELEVGGGSRS